LKNVNYCSCPSIRKADGIGTIRFFPNIWPRGWRRSLGMKYLGCINMLQDIARNLAITPETVKSHVKHIFTKLNVEKRAQAVSRAQTLWVGRDSSVNVEHFLALGRGVGPRRPRY
jgi:hypothetical protein